jgi:hypothetical protein
VRQTSDLLHESSRNSDPLHAPTEPGTIDSHAHNKTSALHAPNRTSDHLQRTKQNLEHLEHIQLTETATFDKHRTSDS